jgi:hypothetical protein
MSEETARPSTSPSATQNRRFRAGAVVALALAVGLILWLALRNSDNSSTTSAPANATAVSVDQIRTLATSVAHPVFWVGPKAGYTYELTRTSNGSIFIRYLPPGEKVGIKTPYLTVATYPFPGAYEAIQAVSKQKDVTPITVAHNGIAEVSSKNPQSVHAAYPGIDYQIEVFDPTAGTATALVAAGRLTAFGSLKGTSSATGAKPTAASPADLKSLAGSLGHPVYWAGRKKGYTYELTRTSNDQVYIRYLPPGVAVGASPPYLTVATYPFQGAFSAIISLGKQKNAVTLTLANGGRAVIDPAHPKSIHLAYPGSDFQVEVFDPSPARARRVVESGKVSAVG